MGFSPFTRSVAVKGSTRYLLRGRIPGWHSRRPVLISEVSMIEVTIGESDRLDGALRAFKKKVLRSGILQDLRRKRYYLKPSEARQLKSAAARRRRRSRAAP